MKEKMKEKMKENIKQLIKNLKTTIQSIVKVKNKIVFKMKRKIYNLMYRRLTYIPEKGMWVSTVVFPKDLAFIDKEDNVTICGVTDVFAGNEKKVDFEPLHTVYIKKASESGNIHREVVKRIMKNGVDI